MVKRKDWEDLLDRWAQAARDAQARKHCPSGPDGCPDPDFATTVHKTVHKAGDKAGDAKAKPGRYHARCHDCGEPSKGFYRCYPCSLRLVLRDELDKTTKKKENNQL